MKQNNGVQSYNQIIYESGPIKVSDYLSSVPNKVHEKLYRDALDKFFNDHIELKEKYSNLKIIEIKPKEYWMPSSIRIIDYTKYPRKYYTFDLTNYWNNVYVEKTTSKVIEENPEECSQIDYLDYIHGKATMKGKYSNDTFKIDFSKLAYNVETTDSFDIYKTTFAYRKEQLY